MFKASSLPLARSLAIGMLVLAVGACTTSGGQNPDTKRKPDSAAEGPSDRVVDVDATGPLKNNASYREALRLSSESQFRDAEPFWQALVIAYPDDASLYANLGIALARSNRGREAWQALQKASTLDDSIPEVFNELGILYRKANKFQDAEAAYQRALTLRSDYAKAHFNIAILYDEFLKRPADALRHYQRYQQLSSGNDRRVALWIKEIEQRQPAPTAISNTQ